MSKVAGANLPRTVERASGQALLIRFAAGLPIGIHRVAVASSMGSPQCYHGIVLKHHPFVKVL